MLRIVLADDHGLLRSGMRRLLESTGRVSVVAEASNGIQSISEVKHHKPDMLLLDIQMPKMDGLEVIHQLAKLVTILVISAIDNVEYVRRAFRLGASGYLTKHNAGSELLTAVFQVAAGVRYLSPDVSGALELSPSSEAHERIARLSNREFQVMAYLAQGLNHREIAAALTINTKTVDSHRNKLLKKLRLKNNVELTRFAIQHGMTHLS